jgi:serine/threonine protein kinase
MSEVKNDAKAIFLEALDYKGADELLRFLEQTCGTDAALRTRVEELLRAHQEAGAFLGGAEKQSVTRDLPITECLGTVIGPYKLLQQIGEGGMGTVYMAEQTQPVQRKVALKLIKAGMDSRQVITRFEAERQALAMMDHVNIARVFDGGATEAGRPYFVMELVHGVPITKYCDDNHLTPRQRLELFVPVCQAIQHAHQKGIIHRDIKPSNVMITLYDGKPVPKVIDFGVAKATEQKLTERTLFTQYGAMVGTFEYMSPEQAEMSALGVDTRSDIFSLGVLLYELLTGSTPLSHKRIKEAAYGEILRMIREEEAPKPSTRLSDSGEALASISANRHTEPAKLTKLVRGELDWIVMKTLEKDRNRRYETAKDFAADVERYLGDEPVLACPPSRGYRLRKFARRNKKSLVVIASLAVVMLAGTIFSSWQAVRATRAEQQALVNFDRAHEAVKRMLTRVAQEKLVGVPWMGPVRKALLEDALEFYEQLLTERNTDPEIRLATAQAQITLAWINWRFGETAKLESSYQRALALLEGLVAEFPEDLRYRAALANGLHHYSHRTAWDKKRWNESAPTLRRAIDLQESVVAANPDSADDAYDLTNMLNLLGHALRTGGQRDEAQALFKRAVAISERILNKEPNHARHLCGQVSGLTHIAEDLIGIRQDLVQAETVLNRAQAIAVRLQAADQKHGFLFDRSALSLAHLDQCQGALHRLTGRSQDMHAAYRRAAARLQKYADDYPTDRFLRAHLALCYFDLAVSLTDPEDRQEAEQAFQQAIRIQEKIAADFPKEVGLYYGRQLWRTYHYFARWLHAAEQFDEAEKTYRQALALGVKLAEEFADDSDYRNGAAWSAEELGRLLEEGERLDEAEQLYRQSLKFHQANVAAQPTDTRHSVHVARLQRRLAQLLRASGRPEEAIKHCANLVAESPEELDYRILLSSVHHDVGRAADEAKRPADAEAAFRNALKVMETAAADFPKDAKAWEFLGYRARSLATFMMAQKCPAEAEKAWAKGIHAFDTAGALPDPVADNCRYWAAVTRHALAESALTQGRPKEAEELWQKALDTFHALPATLVQTDKRHRTVTGGANRYAGWLRSQNRPQEAIAVMQRGIDFYGGLFAKMPTERIFRDELIDQSRKLAWFLATAPNPKIRDAKRAVELAKKAVELAPEQGIYWNTLGTAHYRAGQWQDAVTALEKSTELCKGGDSFDWFLLAMAHRQLGHKDDARKWYDQAVAWMDKNQPENEELRRIRAEAAKLLGIGEKKD